MIGSIQDLSKVKVHQCPERCSTLAWLLRLSLRHKKPRDEGYLMMVRSLAEGLIIAIHGDYACGTQLCCVPIGWPANTVVESGRTPARVLCTLLSRKTKKPGLLLV